MSLKDDLIKKAASGNLGKKEEKEEVSSPSFEETSVVEEEPVVEKEESKGSAKDIDFDSLMNETLGEDISSFEEKPVEELTPEPIPEPVKIEEPEPIIEEETQETFNEPVTEDFNNSFNNNFSTQQDFYNNNGAMNMNQGFDQPPTTNFNFDGNSSLEESLLKLAKETVLNDIDSSDAFVSEIVTAETLSKLILSYLTNDTKGSKISNSNVIFSSVIDEVIDKKWQNDYYKDLTEDILNSIKSEL